MKNKGILNPNILEAVASLGHTEYLVICDAGLPIPDNIKKIDISLTHGIPTFDQVLSAIASELVIESYIVAAEITEKNPTEFWNIQSTLKEIPHNMVPHEDFKKLTRNAKCIIRTGETKPYANIIIVGGVNF